jgi:hypothetical protein
MIILTMSTGRFEHELDSIPIFNRANKNITDYFYTWVGAMIGWLIGNVIWWVGLIVVVMWLVQKCAI